jgi:acyl-CoA synthetase (AMP-forming)/AMP-acid ligase II
MDNRSPAWLGTVPPTRFETHFDGRVVRCFVERPRSAYALLECGVARNPEGEAIVCGDTRLTYRAFADLVARCAAGLERRGVGRGDRVALLLGNDVAFPAILFAALGIGAIAVPISTREQTPGLAYMLAHCGAKALVHDADLTERLPAAKETPELAHRIASQSAIGDSMRLRAVDGSRRRPRSTRRIRRSSSTHPAPPAGRRAPCSPISASAIRPCTTSAAWG